MSLDLDHIEQAASWAAQELANGGGSATVHLTPNDGTLYCFVITMRQRVWSREGVRLRSPLVTLNLGNMGMSHEWNGYHIHPDYAADKWTTTSHAHTGKIVRKRYWPDFSSK